MNGMNPPPAMANMPNMANPYVKDTMTNAYQENAFNQMVKPQPNPQMQNQMMMASALRSNY